MGAVYHVEAKIKLKDEQAAITALNQHIKNDTRTEYNLKTFEKYGIVPDTFDHLMRIFLAGYREGSFRITKQKPVVYYYQNSFEASYGWESVLVEMFQTLTPYIDNGSFLKIWPDNGYTRLVIRDNKCIRMN